MDIPFHQEQLQFMVGLAGCRTSYFNFLFQFLNYVDSLYFTFILVPFVWVGFSYRWGIRLYYIFAVNQMVNAFFKHLVGWPRPSTDLPEIGLYHPASNGFPSGGAEMAFFIGGLIAYYWKSKWAWPLGIFYILLLSFSRLYIGVHYPIDVLGGWIIGFVLLWIFIQTIEPLEKWLQKKGLVFSFFLSEALPLALLLVTTSTLYHRYDAMCIGLGIFLSLKYHLYLAAPKSKLNGVARGLIAVFGLFALFFCVKHLPVYAMFGVVSLWLSLFASPMIKTILPSRT